ncbi:MAG: hypothetical protein J6P77_04755 [Acetobacter sp.]|nr:hypothetical protein [Acetobacter sp.]
MKKSAPLKFLLTLGLTVSLSGCAGWGTWNNNWNDNWNNITGGARNYGQYPTPNEETCFINPTTVNAKQQGLYDLAFQKARQGIPTILLVKNYLIPATNQLFVNNNPQPLNALYAQIQPQTLANFMIGCNEVIVKERAQLIQERDQLIQERAQLIQDVNNQRNQIATVQNYLNTTPAPQPTLQTFQEYDEHLPKMAFIGKASRAFNLIYEAKPTLLFLLLCLYTPVDQIDTLLNINTIQGLQNFQQQLQQRHLMTGPPPEIPQINWEKYKITFSSIFVGAIERVLDPSLIKTSIRKLEQQLQEVHQQLQNIHQQLQNIHQAFSGSHPHTMLVESQATMDSPSADIKFWESLPYHGTAGSLGIINWDKALIAAQHGNYMPFIDIYSQMQPQTWRNFFVNYYKWGQKTHQKAHITHHQKWNS